ncbi:hypothetical protein CLI64_01140 [Nostoc sp. CENA543]|nr:hypothetical protein CLI64_01140 [Nostoc sp. CENA543]
MKFGLCDRRGRGEGCRVQGEQAFILERGAKSRLSRKLGLIWGKDKLPLSLHPCSLLPAPIPLVMSGDRTPSLALPHKEKI